MPVLVPETPVTGRILVAAELRPHGVVDQLGQVVRDFDIGAQAKEYIASLAGLVLLAPNTAIAEVRNGADAVVERNALLAVGLVLAPLTPCIADFDIGK